MKLPQNFDTSIDQLLTLSNQQTIFLSSWDRTVCTQDIPWDIIHRSSQISILNINKYQYMDEMQEIKKYISSSIYCEEKIAILPSKIAIVSNGTAASYLSLMVLNKRRKIKPLIFTPIYFAYISSLKELCDDIEYYQIFFQDNVTVDFDQIENIVKNKKINTIIMNDPVFGCGISIKKMLYKQLISLCEKYKITLVVDYVYGGMEWNENNHYTQPYLLRQIAADKDIVLIDSMTKRLFINGIKNAIVYGRDEFINEFEKTSVYTLGCMVYSQVNLLSELYNPKNKAELYKLIEHSIFIAKNNYELIKSLSLDSNCYIEHCNSGCFSLLKIPYNLFNNGSNMYIAQSILKKCNILTIPHDRYLYFDTKNYCFRINLLLSKEEIVKGLSSIIKSFD